jgi:cobalt-zinc-cadmium efflux system outer membrane protein
MNRCLLVLLVVASCSSPAIKLDEHSAEAATQEGESRRRRTASILKLDDAIALSDRHPDLTEAHARVDAARARAIQAGVWPNPALSGRVEAAGSDQREYLAGVSQGIPLGGRLSRSLAAAGETLALDVTRTQMELAKIRLERDRASSLAQEALIELAASIGQAGLRIPAVEGSLESAFELPTIESLAEHPSLKAARAGVDAQEARLDLAKAQRIPDVNVELLYRRLDATGENAFDVGLSVSLPLFGSTVREARAERRAAQARVEKSAVELERDLQRAHVRLARALESLRTLKALLAQQDEIARAYEARYSAGDASLADVLPVRRDRVAVRLMHLETLREVMEAWAGLTPFRG